MLTIRPLRPWDAAFCWRIANEPSVRVASVDRSAPTLRGHARWMRRWLFGRYRKAWVVRCGLWYGHLKPRMYHHKAGLVRVERRGHRAIIGVAVLPDYRGRGIAQTAIRRATDYVRANEWGIPTAYIRPANTPSLLAFRGAGFDVGREVDGFVVMEQWS